MTTQEQIQSDLKLIARLVRNFPTPLEDSPNTKVSKIRPSDLIDALIVLMTPPAGDFKLQIASRIEQFADEFTKQSGHIVIKFDKGKIEAECELDQPVCCTAHAEMIFRTVVLAYTNSTNRVTEEQDQNGWQLTLDRTTPLLYSVASALLDNDAVNTRTILRTESHHA